MNEHDYTTWYYLAPSIYPPWSTFVKTISDQKTKKHNFLAQTQEACREDIERAFEVLQARFVIFRGPARFWDKKSHGNIMTICVILHKMILEDKRDLN